MRLGILGGSFDPVHYGHLLLAESCWDECSLDRVWFVPAAVPPHKSCELMATGEQRAEMLELALADDPSMEVCRMELDRGGISYSVDTLRALHAAHPGAELFLLLGSDALSDLPQWRSAAEICRLATPIVVSRAGSPPPDLQVLAEVAPPTRVAPWGRIVEMPPVGLSSTDIRRRVAGGRSIRYQTPQAVVRYIEQHDLYLNLGRPSP